MTKPNIPESEEEAIEHLEPMERRWLSIQKRRPNVPDPDKFVAVLEELFLRFNFGKITFPEDDIALIAQFISYIPPHAAFLRDEYAAGFARALDLLRRQKDLRWTN